MNDVHMNAVDLNLLRLFDVMMDERNVTRAGHRLGLTQSAVSHALNRLRAALKDELFVRGPDGMQPTPFANEAASKIHAALNQIQDALASADFDPAISERRFVIAASPYVSEVLAPALFARFRREAPRAELSLRPVETAVADALDTGRIDMAIAGFGRVPDRFERETLFSDSLVWAMRADHPAAGQSLTLEALAQLPRLLMAVREQSNGDYIVEGGLERRVVWDGEEGVLDALPGGGGPVYTVYDVPSALFIASRSDLATLIPSRLARQFAESGRLKLFEPPYPSAPAELVAICRKDHGSRPAMLWFKALLREEAEGL